MGAQKFMVRRNYLGAMSAQARHCVTLRWPLPEVHANRRTIVRSCYNYVALTHPRSILHRFSRLWTG